MKNYRGIYYMLIASFSFALMGVFVKRLGKEFDTVEIVLFRNLVGVAVLLFSIVKRPIVQKGGNVFLLLFRGIIGTISLYAFAYNLVYSSLGEAFTFYQTSSFFIAFFSYFVLKEKLNSSTWLGLLIGFAGIIFVFRPDIQLLSFKNFMGLTNGALSAMAYMAIGELKKNYDTRTIVITFMSFGILLPILSIAIGQFYYHPQLAFMLSKGKMPEYKHLFDILAVGLSALLGQVYVTKAFGVEKAGIVSAISYSNVIFSVFLGVLISGDKFPDVITLLGMLLIISSGLLISLTKENVGEVE